MSIKTLHKWLFSLTLLLSLASFQGYATTANKTLTTTEWIVSEHNASETKAYYVCFTASKFISNSFTGFSFNSLLRTQKMNHFVKYKVQNQTVLSEEKLNAISKLKLISPVNTDVFIITS